MRAGILFSLAFFLCVFKVNSAPDPVLDVYWKKLRTGVEYIVMPTAQVGERGGIILGAMGNKTCPAGVAQLRTNEYGHPLTITPVNPKKGNPKKGVIRLSTDVNIKFSGSTICHESTVWKLEYDTAMRQYAVMVGGVKGNPGPETLDNWFKIEKTNNGYKFVYCPSVCTYCKVMCRNVGIVVDENGLQRLALSDDPLSVIFYP
ncbi:hypothetical protein QVD17_04505 [Tagetes erecta]|uniref:Miraculin n=1 Tax=Tagetes erecta TaxID=13708 RepID=A0AAD8LA96_TARER|nr:hypothetical protein QVD17_04505 [Tagetes erecta]